MMKLPIKRAIKRPIKRSIISGANKRWFTLLDGSTNYISHPVWTPTGVNFELRLKVRFDSGSIGRTVDLLADSDSTGERLHKLSSDALRFSYADVGGTNRNVVLTGFAPTAGTDYEVSITSNGGGVTLSAGGVSVTNINVIDPADVNLINIAANNTGTSNFLGGRIWDVEYTDLSFIQDGEFLQGNGADLYVQVNIPVGVSDTLKVEYQHEASVGTQAFMAGDFTAALGVIGASGAFSFGSYFSSVTVDGSPIVSGGFSFVSGQSYVVECILNTAENITNVYSTSSPGAFNGGIFAGLEVTKLNNDTYYYTLKDGDIIDNGDGTGTVVNTGTTGSAFNATIQNYSSGTDLVAKANNSRLYKIDEESGSVVVDSKGDGSTDGTFIGTRNTEQG
jgi:hypothetical protein